MKKTNIKGLSLIEILIVISIFAVIGILSTRSIFLTLRGARKSESQVKVRENLNFALAVVERQIRNAEDVNCTASTTALTYTALEGVQSTFTCTAGADKYLASGAGRLTSTEITLTTCTITCTQSTANKPPTVKISLVAQDNTTSSVEKGSVTVETEISPRNY
jgi:prepilin-type N-terminal cleavage/methylation domain-containing protein